jgi:hypothetical protein
MGIEIAALKAAVIEADARARLWLSEGRLDAVEGGYETLLATLNALLSSNEEYPHGWQQVALVLTDLNRRLTIDALASGRGSELQMRAAALLDLPDMVNVRDLADIHNALAAAINIGSPRYNSGDIRGCCRLYWTTIQTVLAAPAVRGFAGHAKALGHLRAAVETEPPSLPLDAVRMDELAWALRREMDVSLTITS